MASIHGSTRLALCALAGFGISAFGQAQEPDPFKEALIKVLTGVQADAVQKLEPGQRGDWARAASLVTALIEKQAGLAAKTKGTEASKDAEAKKAALGHLATMLAGGEGAAQAEAKLFENASAAAAAVEHLGTQLTNQRRQLAVGMVLQGFNSGARYAGQYSALTKLGPGIETLLLATVENPPQGVPDAVRATLLSAMRDVGPKLDEAMRKRVSDLADDQFEDEGVQMMASYLLYACGDKARVEKRVEALRSEAEKGKDPSTFQQLAEIFWQVGEHDKAIDAYKSAIESAGDMPKNAIATLYYNMACSQSLAGKIDDAFATLDKGMPMMDAATRANLLKVDHDLNNLRKDERFAKLLEKFGTKPKSDQAKPEEGDKAKTGGEEGK